MQNAVEYYDELYPVTAEQQEFYAAIKTHYAPPVRFLHIGCGTGALEHFLVKDGSDVTGLEVSKELITAAALHRKTQLTPIRFFQLSTLEMKRFLGKNFYNIISCLNSRIVFIREKELLKMFFIDCKTLLAQDGMLVLQLYNFYRLEKNGATHMPPRGSIRVKQDSFFVSDERGRVSLTQTIETGNGKILPVMKDEELYPLTKTEIVDFAQSAGFCEFEFYGSFSKEAFAEESAMLVCVLK